MWKMGSLSTSGIGAYDRIMEVAARWLGRYPNDAAALEAGRRLETPSRQTRKSCGLEGVVSRVRDLASHRTEVNTVRCKLEERKHIGWRIGLYRAPCTVCSGNVRS